VLFTEPISAQFASVQFLFRGISVSDGTFRASASMISYFRFYDLFPEQHEGGIFLNTFSTVLEFGLDGGFIMNSYSGLTSDLTANLSRWVKAGRGEGDV